MSRASEHRDRPLVVHLTTTDMSLDWLLAPQLLAFQRAGYDIVDIDGVRMKFDDGWGLIRASNTQPVLVMRFEAGSRENLEKYRTLVESEIDEIKRGMAEAC